MVLQPTLLRVQRDNCTLTVVTNDLKVLNTFLFFPDFSVVSETSDPSPPLEKISSLGFPGPSPFSVSLSLLAASPSP